MRLYQQLLTENDCYRMGDDLIPKGVMVHSTGANNPNLSRYVGPDDGRLGHCSSRNWNQGGISRCVHAFVGKLPDGTVAIYQTLPWTMRGWHAGGAANNTHIGFEICEDDLSDEHYFRAVYNQAVELTAALCRKFHLDPMAEGVVICHAEGHQLGVASNHADVNHWFPKFGKSMDEFRSEVQKAMEDAKQEQSYEQWRSYMERYRQELTQRKPIMPDLYTQAKDLSLTDGTRPGDLVTREECAVMARNAVLRMREER